MFWGDQVSGQKELMYGQLTTKNAKYRFVRNTMEAPDRGERHIRQYSSPNVMKWS